MTRLSNVPADFADEMVDGFVAANERYVRKVPGGVARSTVTPQGQVALVIGGGSGHYPAFGGLVGQGLAHGAAMGNLFASPATSQVESIGKIADTGAGVLLSYGNYAGDVLNFDAARDRLRAQGIACESVAVTDDISSAALAEKHKRRGIAGDLTVFKSAAAAAEAGYDLAEVTRVARLANERTRSFGVAFTGCTLPGASEPLFTVPEGRMAVGMGIHGEPGIGETDIPTADELAELLVSRLVLELPEGVESAAGARVVPILNGLGSVKYEELFVVYRRIAQLLEAAGLVLVDPHVGEFCTSFDMAGTSLTLFWLDPELEGFWNAPVDTPAYRKGSVAAVKRVGIEALAAAEAETFGESTEDSRLAAGTVLAAIEAAADLLDERVEELGRMDAIAGDGDHGIGMQRGATAARSAARRAEEAGAGAGSVLTHAGDAWAAKAGGTSGALWGLALRTMGERIGDAERPSAVVIADAIDGARRGIQAYGKAEVGDKTMVDALVPFADTLAAHVAAGVPLGQAWQAAAGAATVAAAASADLMPRMGRARPHAEKALGTPDPGAHSLALIVTAIGAVLAERAGTTD